MLSKFNQASNDIVPEISSNLKIRNFISNDNGIENLANNNIKKFIRNEIKIKSTTKVHNDSKSKQSKKQEKLKTETITSSDSDRSERIKHVKHDSKKYDERKSNNNASKKSLCSSNRLYEGKNHHTSSIKFLENLYTSNEKENIDAPVKLVALLKESVKNIQKEKAYNKPNFTIRKKKEYFKKEEPIINNRLNTNEPLLDDASCKNQSLIFEDKGGNEVNSTNNNHTNNKNIEEILQEDENWDKLEININSHYLSNHLISNTNKRGLNLLSKVYDSITDEEEENDIGDIQSRYSINPYSSSILILNTLILICLFATLVINPFFFCFEIDIFYSTAMLLIFLLIDIIFLAEFVINMFIGFYMDEYYVSKHKYILINYFVNKSLIIDVIHAIPFNLFLYIEYYYNHSNESNTAIFFNFILNDTFTYYCALLRWTKIIGLLRFCRIMEFYIYNIFKLEGFQKITKRLEILKQVILVFIILHNLTCLWIYIGNLEKIINFYSWLHYDNAEIKSRFGIYVSSLYYNITTIVSVGYGDIYPRTTNEKAYALFFLFISTQFYNLFISWASSMISESSKKDQLYNYNLEILSKIVSDYHVPNSIEQQLKKSLIFQRDNISSDSLVLLNSLPESLKNLIYKRIFDKKLSKLHFFKSTSEEFIYYVMPRLQIISFKKNECLISSRDMFTELFLITKGEIGFYLTSIYDNFRLLRVRNNNYFGDINMFLNSRSEYNIKSTSNKTEIFTMKKNIYSDLKTNFPEIIEKIIQNSLDNYTSLENLRLEAIDYFRKNKTMIGFKFLKMIDYTNKAWKEIMKEEKRSSINTYCPNNLLKNIIANSNEIDDSLYPSSKILSVSNVLTNKKSVRHIVNNTRSLSNSNLAKVNDIALKKIKNKDTKTRKIYYTYQQVKENSSKQVKLVKDYKEDKLKIIKKLKNIEFAETKTLIKFIKRYEEDNISFISCNVTNKYHEINLEKKCFLRSKNKIALDKSNSSSESNVEKEKKKLIQRAKASNNFLNALKLNFVKLDCLEFNDVKVNPLPNQKKVTINLPVKENNGNKDLKKDKKNLFKKLISRHITINKDKENVKTPMETDNITPNQEPNAKSSFMNLDRKAMATEFGKKIDTNVYFENNMNAFEDYLKTMIIKTKNKENNKTDFVNP